MGRFGRNSRKLINQSLHRVDYGRISRVTRELLQIFSNYLEDCCRQGSVPPYEIDAALKWASCDLISS